MVLPASIMYIIGIIALAILLITGRTLKNMQQNEITQRERIFRGFHFLGVAACIFYASILIFLELMSLAIAQFDRFLVDFFSASPIVYLFPGLLFVLVFMFGYQLDPREKHAPPSTLSDKWISLIVFLILLAGALGFLTGILI